MNISMEAKIGVSGKPVGYVYYVVFGTDSNMLDTNGVVEWMNENLQYPYSLDSDDWEGYVDEDDVFCLKYKIGFGSREDVAAFKLRWVNG